MKPGNLIAEESVKKGAKSCGENPRDEEFVRIHALERFTFRRFYL